MYLKRLELQGFKSFVDRTILEFGDGITGIVGPNGSGKSNLSDAVKWVLGEQSPKTLRGGRMEDVIFSGTEKRRPVGFAEVSLVMDNEDHKLNIDFREVTITRRLYRSGESEYLINGSNCRLKDIHLLFADTGVGKDGYSIISQGKVDEILNSKSEDRRSIFEDASGIMKYRIRKQESERKLESAEQNLLRINDILSELEYQIGPLTQQAETAKQYLALKYELRDIEVGVLVDGIRRAGERLADAESKCQTARQQIEEQEAQLEQLKKDNWDKNERSRLLEERLGEAREQGFALEKQMEHLLSDLRVNEEKIAALQEQGERYTGEAQEQKGRQQELANRQAQIAETRRQSQEEWQKAQEDIGQMEEKYQSILALLSDDAARAETLNQTLLGKKLEAGGKQSGVSALTQQIRLVEERKVALEGERAQVEGEETNLQARIATLQQEQQQVEDRFQKTKESLDSALSGLKEKRQEEESLSQQWMQLNAQQQSKRARLHLLKEMEENQEGYGKGVREILALCRNNAAFGKGIHGAVAQLITVPAEMELAVETALGGAYQNIVTETEEDAKQAISYLKERHLGRATFLPISAVSGRLLEADTKRRLSSIHGYLGAAIDLVDYQPSYQNIVANLLGRVAVFRTLDAAIQAAKQFRYGFICVTLEGDILRTSGAITGGSADTGKRTGVLARTREIPELDKELGRIQKEHDAIAARREQCRNAIDAMEREQAQAFQQVRTAEAKVAACQTLLAGAQKEQESLVKRKIQLAEDIRDQEKYLCDFREAILALQAEEQLLLGEIAALQQELSQYEEKNRTAAGVKEALQKDLTALQLRETECRARLEHLDQEAQRVQQDIQDSQERMEYLLLQAKDQEGLIKAIAEENQSLAQQVKQHTELQTGAVAEVERLAEEKKEVDEDLSGMLDRSTQISETIGGLREEAGRLEIRKVKAEGEVEANKNRLWEEYELTYNKAVELTGGVPPANYGACQKRINELKQAIRALGTVNVSAIEDLESTKQRYDFMAGQRQDMEEAKKKLLKVIGEVTQVMKQQFMEEFRKIRANFGQVFCDLFGGGKADIVLADEANVLESGIDIQVQPPGKKLQSMLLLSGGERALTAIALLFAILRTNPSPFCLLDEIEAALDEANVYRFAEFLQGAAGASQFIVVTHRKGTMEAANTLYGVTMEEKGVSRVVSMRLEK